MKFKKFNPFTYDEHDDFWYWGYVQFKRWRYIPQVVHKTFGILPFGIDCSGMAWVIIDTKWTRTWILKNKFRPD